MIAGGVYLFTLFLQIVTGRCNKTIKRKEAFFTDQRLKLVTDMVAGARTIKCYGWEHYYIDKS